MEEWLFTITIDYGAKHVMVTEAPRKMAMDWLFFHVQRASTEMMNADIQVRMSVLREVKK